MTFSIKHWVAVGAVSSALAFAGCTDRSSERPIASDRAALGGSGTAGTTVPANESHASESDSMIHEAHPSTVEANAPNFAPSDEIGVGGSGMSGTGGSGKPDSKDGGSGYVVEPGTGGSGKGGHGGHQDGGTGGSGFYGEEPGTGGAGFDGLGTDVQTDRGIRRDSDKGTTMDNGTSLDVAPGTSSEIR